MLLIAFLPRSVSRGDYSRSPAHSGFSLPEVFGAVKESIWEFPLPFVVLGGIYGGYFVVSEAAAITATYVLIVEVFIYRDINGENLPEIMKKEHGTGRWDPDHPWGSPRSDELSDRCRTSHEDVRFSQGPY